ncbi:plasmid mobilization relaxosome protein MobC [Ochrobactrum sp. C6C9]|uniref:plasmid mobilization protein n=1 Tax=Ochrobactrum sp. C6C9 TaxID=2736662 RepID=UPI00353014C0
MQASPSNPTKKRGRSLKSELDAVVVFRCTAAEKQALIERAAMAGLPFATLLREALGLAETRRRRPVPKVDPELIRAIARIGSNLNQIARWLNTAQRQGNVSAIDAMAVSARLISLDRGLAETLDAFRVREHGQC